MVRYTKYIAATFVTGLISASAYGHPSSECKDAGLKGSALGLCNAYCTVLDCSNIDSDTAECQNLEERFLTATGEAPPCNQTSCDLIEPEVLLGRIALIPNPEYVCYSDSTTPPYEYVEYIVESGGVPQIGLGMEDQFDGTWYGYYFEYQPGSTGELPEFFRYDLAPEEVAACREAFEPPFDCSQ